LSAQDSVIEVQARRLAAELRCPVCQGLSLQDSPAELAQEMKDLIRERLRAGDSPAEVKAYFVSRYGEWVLLDPPARGFNLAVWLVPVLALLGGAALVLYVVRRWVRQAPAPAAPPLDDEDRARVRRELERLEADRD
jgi:cytochrome c-type biogenesis protein CcmH